LSKLQFEILSPAGVIADLSEMESVHVRLENGQLIGIYPGHTNLIGTVAAGSVRVVSADEEKTLEIPGGILRVEKDHVRILTIV
jgi:F0F1-type ATP synthase epsilon subunit